MIRKLWMLLPFGIFHTILRLGLDLFKEYTVVYILICL